ncbi:hypothetical protein D3C77_569380 [compost metagenome]
MRAILFDPTLPMSHQVVLAQDDVYGCDLFIPIEHSEVPMIAIIGKDGALYRFIIDPTDPMDHAKGDLERWYNTWSTNQPLYSKLLGNMTILNTVYQVWTSYQEGCTIHWLEP